MSVIAGLLILIMPRLLNLVVAIFLILNGLIGLGLLRWLHARGRRGGGTSWRSSCVASKRRKCAGKERGAGLEPASLAWS